MMPNLLCREVLLNLSRHKFNLRIWWTHLTVIRYSQGSEGHAKSSHEDAAVFVQYDANMRGRTLGRMQVEIDY